MVAWGEFDVPMVIDYVRAVAKRVPGARSEEIPGAAHLPYLERPEAVADLIERALGPLARPGRVAAGRAAPATEPASGRPRSRAGRSCTRRASSPVVDDQPVGIAEVAGAPRAVTSTAPRTSTCRRRSRSGRRASRAPARRRAPACVFGNGLQAVPRKLPRQLAVGDAGARVGGDPALGRSRPARRGARAGRPRARPPGRCGGPGADSRRMRARSLLLQRRLAGGRPPRAARRRRRAARRRADRRPRPPDATTTARRGRSSPTGRGLRPARRHVGAALRAHPPARRDCTWPQAGTAALARGERGADVVAGRVPRLRPSRPARRSSRYQHSGRKVTRNG